MNNLEALNQNRDESLKTEFTTIKLSFDKLSEAVKSNQENIKNLGESVKASFKLWEEQKIAQDKKIESNLRTFIVDFTKAIEEKLESLQNNAINKDKGTVEIGSPVSTGQKMHMSIETSSQEKLPDVKPGFGTFITESDEHEQIRAAIKEAKAWIGSYDSRSILAQLKKFLPMRVLSSVRAHDNTLVECLDQLSKRYNKKTDIFTSEIELTDLHFDKKLNLSRQFGDFIDRVNVYNDKCIDAGKAGSRWNANQALKNACEKVLEVNKCLGMEMMKNVDFSLIGDGYDIDAGEAQKLVAKKERGFLWEKKWEEMNDPKRRKINTTYVIQPKILATKRNSRGSAGDAKLLKSL